MQLLHITPQLDDGGAARTVVDLVKGLRDDIKQAVVSLKPAAARQRADLKHIDVGYHDHSANLDSQIDAADLVLLHFWNTPATYRFLQSPLPPMRLAIWCHVSGLHAPQVITRSVAAFADTLMVANPDSLNLEAVRDIARAVHVPALVDFTGLKPVALRHAASRIGYLGTVDFVKMHRGFVGLCSGITPRTVHFPVWGPGTAYPTLQREASEHGCADRFEWNGPTNDVGAAYAQMDVFGYPLCSDTYAASDRVLAEAMWVGLAPVTFDQPATKHFVLNGETGFAAKSPAEYVESAQRLIADFPLRKRIGSAAMEHARLELSPENILSKIQTILGDMLGQPKKHRAFGDQNPKSGANLFIESLGKHAGHFEASMTSDHHHTADLEIAGSSPALVNSGGGGIVHYRFEYDSDPYLRLWTGLVFARNGRTALARSEFEAARRLGIAERRIEAHIRMLPETANRPLKKPVSECNQNSSTFP